MEGMCPVCGEMFQGRSDKKFCSDLCRNDYHNEKRRKTGMALSRYDSILRRNRNILLKCAGSGKSNIRRELLVLRNFNFDVFTSARFRMMKPTVYFCYDFEYYTTWDGMVHIRNISG